MNTALDRQVCGYDVQLLDAGTTGSGYRACSMTHGRFGGREEQDRHLNKMCYNYHENYKSLVRTSNHENADVKLLLTED